MSKKILVVDDDRMNLTLIRFSLKELRYEVETAENGKVALEVVKSFKPDLIVLDIQMPEMSGYEFMSEIRAKPESAGIPVIMLTANEHLQEVFYSEGVKGYFVKPVDPPKLAAKIKECLS